MKNDKFHSAGLELTVDKVHISDVCPKYNLMVSCNRKSVSAADSIGAAIIKAQVDEGAISSQNQTL